MSLATLANVAPDSPGGNGGSTIGIVAFVIIVWPVRATVHQGATDPSCWRCGVAAVAPAPAGQG